MTSYFDIFLSSPMSAFKTDSEYQNERARMLHLIGILTEAWKVKRVYYAGENFSSTRDFDSELLSMQHCLSALENSSIFLMIYPKSIASSVLIEAGYALAQRKKSIYFSKNTKTLPYILRKPDGISPRPKIYIYKNFEQLTKYISTHRDEILNFDTQMSLFDISLLEYE